MKWFVLCLAVAGLSTSAFAAAPDHSSLRGVQFAQNQCPPPKVMNAAGACVCPPGTHQGATAANVCEPDSKCPPPKVMDPNGRCMCPAGTHQGAAAANQCIPDTCPPPRVMANGRCVCPMGTSGPPTGRCMTNDLPKPSAIHPH